MDTKIKCVLLDDELPGLAYLKMLCEQIPELDVVKAFNDPEKFVSENRNLDYDLCITDIQMPGLDGLSLAGMLENKMLIFITAHKDYAADAFDIEAIDYITKPVKMERLQKAIHKAMQRFLAQQTHNSFLQCNTAKGRTLLYFHRIASITTSSVDSRDKEVILHDGSHILLKNINFAKLLGQLPEKEFCRVNKRQLISLKAVGFYSHSEIILKIKDSNIPNLSVLLTDTFRSEFLEKVSGRVIT